VIPDRAAAEAWIRVYDEPAEAAGGRAGGVERTDVAAPAYRFVDRWFVPHPIEPVYELMSDVYRYPEWWGDVWVSASGHAGAPSPGTRTQVVAHGYLPYKLRYAFECVAVDAPHRVDSILHGDFEGTATLSFEEVEGGTSVVLDFRPLVNKAGVRQLTPLLRPLFRSNHRWAMRRGQAHIVERLRV
jgi:uncharacterized protein YndB with AHSA1/START domain